MSAMITVGESAAVDSHRFEATLELKVESRFSFV
jgi:hypothetical protein